MTMFLSYNIDMSTLNSGAIIVVPLIVAIVQALKMTNWVQNRFAPLISIGVGIIISFISNHDSGDISQTVLYGVAFGLMASGIYSGVKTTINAQAQEQAKQQGRNNNNNGNDGNNFI